MHKIILLFIVLVLLAGCGVVKRGTTPWDDNTNPKTPITSDSDTIEKDPDTFVEQSQPPKIQEMQEFLQLAYKDWKGVPYILGGSGYDGIDCSAFMQVVFEDYFFLQIPRTTRKQLGIGKNIKKDNGSTGDLVFFKTGRTTYHVGVLINRNEFLHASTSNGVTVSEMNHPYWTETYLTTKRIF